MKSYILSIFLFASTAKALTIYVNPQCNLNGNGQTPTCAKAINGKGAFKTLTAALSPSAPKTLVYCPTTNTYYFTSTLCDTINCDMNYYTKYCGSTNTKPLPPNGLTLTLKP